MEYPERLRDVAIPPGFIELRIHGVSGTPAEDLLKAYPTRTRGDGKSGFYSSDADAERKVAYSWGGLTSGSRVNAWWWLLLPFSLANVAGWMIPGFWPADDGRRARHTGLVRIAALATTVLATLGTCFVFMDVGIPLKANVEFEWLNGVFEWWTKMGLAGKLAIAAVLAGLIPVGLSLVAGRTRDRYEKRAVNTQSGDPANRVKINSPELWHNVAVARFLGPLHAAAALGMVAIVVGGFFDSWWYAGLTFGGIAVIAACIVLIAWEAFRPDLVSQSTRLFYIGGGAVWFAGLLAARLGSPVLPAPEATASVGAFTYVTGGIVLLVVLVLLNRLISPGVGGWSRPNAMIAMANLSVASAVSGIVWLIEDRLGEGAVARKSFDWLPVILLVTLMVTFAPFLWRWNALSGRGSAAWFSRLRSSLAKVPNDLWVLAALPALVVTILLVRGLSDSFPVSNLWWLTLLMLLVPLLSRNWLAWLVTIGLALLVVLVFVPLLPDNVGLNSSSFLTFARFFAFILPVAGVGLLIYRASSNRGLRRSVGVAWDLLNYWPRWYHPWAPPPYTEVAIPDLVDEVRRRVAEGTSVIVSGHSQGAVIALPVLFQAADPNVMPESKTIDMGKVSFLSYGCLIGRHYSYLFPAYFNPSTVAELNGLLGGKWLNLFRETDPLGQRIADIPREEPITPYPIPGRDGAEPTPAVGGPKLYTHSNYQYNDEYRTAIAQLTGIDAGTDIQT